MKENQKLKLTIPNKMEFLQVAQNFVHNTAQICGFDNTNINLIDMAAEEAVSNVIQHTYDAEENPTFDIICEILHNGLKIIIKEKGLPFDPSTSKKYHKAENIEDATAEGLGLYLMSNLMDHYSFHNLGIDGKETHFIKYFTKDTELNLNYEIKSNEPEVIKEKLEYSVRGMEASEAVEISKCAYKSHGYSFFDEHIYYPEKLVELNHDGSMISAVAVTKDNTFMGHAALLYQYPEDEIAELTFVFVNVEYRGQGALNKLIEYLFNEPKPRVLKGIYAYAVANHIFTQKAMVKYKINDCGLLLATSPSSWKFKGISDDTSQRISVVLSYIYMMEPESKTLYLPAKHSELIKKLYNNLGCSVHNFIENVENFELIFDNDSEIDYSDNELEGCGEIHIKEYGKDVIKQIRKITRSMCIRNISSINLFLSLEDKNTQLLCSEIEKLGYFFAGILPESKVGDALILQYLNNVDLDYSKIHAYSDMAKEIMEYIKSNDPNIID